MTLEFSVPPAEKTPPVCHLSGATGTLQSVGRLNLTENSQFASVPPYDGATGTPPRICQCATFRHPLGWRSGAQSGRATRGKKDDGLP